MGAATLKVDEAIGKALRKHRRAADISQTKLAERVGITFQQVCKYETGKSRVYASQLYVIAHALGVPVSAFYEAAEKDERGRK